MSIEKLDDIDHIALQVSSVENAMKWYQERFKCEVAYQDDTWGMLKFGNINLAFVIPEEHPAHIGFRVAEDKIPGKVSERRDGERTTYSKDAEGNIIEWLAPLEGK